MADAPSNSNQDPGSGSDPNAGGDNNGGSTPPAPTPPSSDDNLDPSKLTPEQIAKLQEHPEFFKTERMKRLLDDSAALKKLQDEQQKQSEQKLKDEKKFEELSQQKETENSTLREQIQNMTIDQALTTKLVPEGVVDIEAALKLADRSKIKVAEDGTVSGVDEVISALKTDKAYLFGKPGQPQVGGPTNPNNQPSGPAKFKRSQLRDTAFYNEHRDEILAAQKAGLIEDDISSPK